MFAVVWAEAKGWQTPDPLPRPQLFSSPGTKGNLPFHNRFLWEYPYWTLWDTYAVCSGSHLPANPPKTRRSDFRKGLLLAELWRNPLPTDNHTGDHQGVVV